MKIAEIRRVAAPLCQEFNVERLEAFGSTARESRSRDSDIDLLVEFKDPEQHPAKRFFGLLHGLKDTLGCEVDLYTPQSLRNPYFKERVLKEKVPVYER